MEFDPADGCATRPAVRQLGDRARARRLPPAATVEANVLTPQTEPVLSYALDLHDAFANAGARVRARTILPALYGMPGLARALVVGGAEREYHVDLDPASLAAAGLIRRQDVVDALAAANDVSAVGSCRSVFAAHSACWSTAASTTRATLARVVVPTRDRAGVPLSARSAASASASHR